MPRSRTDLAFAAALLALGGELHAQSPAASRAAELPATVSAALLLTSAPAAGRDGVRYVTELLKRSQWRRDGLGSWVLRRGTGAPRRVVACALDQPTFVVSEITDDGFLRLHDPADPRRHPLWAQFHEGQQVSVVTSSVAVAGVVGVRSTHLWRRRPPQESPSTVDDLWVDVGAGSRTDAEHLGIELLDPVERAAPIWIVGGDSTVVGPAMAARAGCAAVAAAAQAAPSKGETIFVLGAQSPFNHTGLSAVLARLGRVDTLVLVDAGLARGSAADAPPPDEAVTARAAQLPFRIPTTARAAAVVAVGVRSMFPGTLVEAVSGGDRAALAAQVAKLAGVRLVAPARAASIEGQERVFPGVLAEASTANLLTVLADAYGVAGHEGGVREKVREAIPPRLRSLATVDSAGNLILSLGPDRDTTVFVAHLDEIGYEVKSIAHDGVVSLTPRGGFFASLWEGQPALLHFDGEDAARRAGVKSACPLRFGADAAIPGVFVPRQTATKKQPDAQTAWFGTDSAGLVACGVRPGMSVTGVKMATRLAGTRFTARSIDDRVGCTALLLALRSIDPAKLTHKVVFVWSVREETGLEGAAALAASLGTGVHRVHAVDTFVSSDSPLESHRFAYAPIGRGAVVRALDNSSATPPAEVERVVALAHRLNVPIQVGTTNGGNDGAELARYGAVDVPLSWPARYSHSPVETIDLLDVDALAKLIAALATE